MMCSVPEELNEPERMLSLRPIGTSRGAQLRGTANSVSLGRERS